MAWHGTLMPEVDVLVGTVPPSSNKTKLIALAA
jgi:hypothetical protein